MDTSQPARLSIGETAERTRCKVETIRYYERIGILPAPDRSPGGQWRYAADHVKRLHFVRRARELGFTLAGVRELLRLVDEENHSCAEAERIARAHLVAVCARLVDLGRLEAVLQDMVEQCAGGALPDCPIIDALHGGPDSG